MFDFGACILGACILASNEPPPDGRRSRTRCFFRAAERNPLGKRQVPSRTGRDCRPGNAVHRRSPLDIDPHVSGLDGLGRERNGVHFHHDDAYVEASPPNMTPLRRATSSIRMTVRYVEVLPIENRRSIGLDMLLVRPGMASRHHDLAQSRRSQRRLGRRHRTGGCPARLQLF